MRRDFLGHLRHRREPIVADEAVAGTTESVAPQVNGLTVIKAPPDFTDRCLPAFFRDVDSHDGAPLKMVFDRLPRAPIVVAGSMFATPQR
jgi:hypothetical protein